MLKNYSSDIESYVYSWALCELTPNITVLTGPWYVEAAGWFWTFWSCWERSDRIYRREYRQQTPNRCYRHHHQGAWYVIEGMCRGNTKGKSSSHRPYRKQTDHFAQKYFSRLLSQLLIFDIEESKCWQGMAIFCFYKSRWNMVIKWRKSATF